MPHVKKPGTPEYELEWLDPNPHGATLMSDDPKTPVILPDEDDEANDDTETVEPQPLEEPPVEEPPAEGEPEPPPDEQRALGAAPENRAR